MNIVKIQCEEIIDWNSFHAYFKKALGFPDYYGENMNAWIDCMSYIDQEELEIKIEAGSILTLQLENVGEFSVRCKEIYDALIECSAFVNYRRISTGTPPILALSYHK